MLRYDGLDNLVSTGLVLTADENKMVQKLGGKILRQVFSKFSAEKEFAVGLKPLLSAINFEKLLKHLGIDVNKYVKP